MFRQSEKINLQKFHNTEFFTQAAINQLACKSWAVRKENEPDLYKNFVNTHDCCIMMRDHLFGSMESSWIDIVL